MYQLQIHSSSYCIAGAEALLRYNSPRFGTISPLKFIPLLEKNKLIYPVGLWVLQKALEQCRLWKNRFPNFHISVNMSYGQLKHPKIEADVLEALNKSGLPGSALTIEVTESMELHDYSRLNIIFSTWKKNGIEISVDDFGTGYSSLSLLKKLTIDEIKIDRCFVNEIHKSAYNYRLLSNMIELAESAKIRVCCEGIEILEELSVLQTLRPTLYQGFLFSKPSLPEDIFNQDFSIWKKWKPDNLLTSKPNHTSSLKNQKIFQLDPLELEHAILENTEDIATVCDMDTYEIYYMNPAGQNLFGVKDYHGRKCYKVFHGKNSPCEFCPKDRLKKNSFHVWENWNEYCHRHFILKDKLRYLNNKKLRIQIGIDITQKEYISKNLKEKVNFSQRIIEYIKLLRNQQNYEQMLNQLLESVGNYYNAHRAYLFERSSNTDDYWNNTYEWCAPGVSPQRDILQNIPKEILVRWLNLFEKDDSVILYNLESIKTEWPDEYNFLHKLEIERIISVPVIVNNQIKAFVGLDNPYKSIYDDSLIRILAAFLEANFI